MNEMPHYRRLSGILRKQIQSGYYAEGSLLPSEHALCAIHGITRPTVRQALEELVREGLIVKRQGKGSIVRKPLRNIGILAAAGTTSAIGQSFLKTVILQKPQLRPWPEEFPFELPEMEREAGCVYLERLRLVDEVPLFYDINHLPHLGLPRFTQRTFENRSLFEILRRHYGIEIRGGEQKLRALIPGPSVREVLQMKPGQPVLYMERKLTTNREGYHIYSTIWFNSEKHAISGVF
ncbi:MAG TPA: GntR family transcriptional regulator [Prolixibacteraceae bacterium]|jgi:GntR family transcriptional regulator/GntR family frlABCD operon transcriptional regulator|nr:GntR family transcriptional regulator [Bacteroidales bacterium]HNQ38659.1 GntR family transcriptional regulator [Prolixibacteraceae bacterium]HPJ78179.1 GntR family transcriptional regulator [Prolixibacteraceae bacterium]HRV89586.1 GntR family transcriptional regulator [Prolixibacteraceae bacterium]